jgi:hypothetical protein
MVRKGRTGDIDGLLTSRSSLGDRGRQMRLKMHATHVPKATMSATTPKAMKNKIYLDGVEE